MKILLAVWFSHLMTSPPTNQNFCVDLTIFPYFPNISFHWQNGALVPRLHHLSSPQNFHPWCYPAQGTVPGYKTENWLDAKTPLSPSSFTSLPHPVQWPANVLQVHLLVFPFAHCLCAFVNVCLDYYSIPLLFYSIPSLPFPFNFNPPVRQVPLLQKVISGSKRLQSRLLGRTYQTVWPTSLTNLHVYFNFHFPKLLVFFFTFEFAASSPWNIFSISPF